MTIRQTPDNEGSAVPDVLIYDLPDDTQWPDLCRKMEGLPHLLILDSVQGRREQDARYSFLTADPAAVVRLERVDYPCDPFTELRRLQNCLPDLTAVSGLPGFCGGIAGLLSYELAHAFEDLPRAAVNVDSAPALLAGLYDWAIVRDHLLQTTRLYVLKLTAAEGVRTVTQEERARFLLDRIQPTSVCGDSKRSPSPPALPVHETGSPLFEPAAFRSNFTREQYLRTVERVIEYIRAGDIFQANLSQQLEADFPGTAMQLFLSVRESNAAPFSGLLQADDFAVVSASPERFLRVSGGRFVETRPIKGTRRRHRFPLADLYTTEDLVTSEKDRAENVMIVDLLRNDLSRVCLPGTVKVTGVCEVEVFETVQHLVSTVVGELRSNCDLWDLLSACFPGGSITGAPKIRAMQIITELERCERGPYCGSLFCLGPGGNFDSSILIRTFLLRSGVAQFPAGGGVVADSDPAAEYEETLHKASGMLKSLSRHADSGRAEL